MKNRRNTDTSFMIGHSRLFDVQLCFVMSVVLTCIRQESANEWYRETVEDPFLLNTHSQKDEKLHTAGL